jgi:hypothetical protein
MDSLLHFDVKEMAREDLYDLMNLEGSAAEVGERKMKTSFPWGGGCFSD